MEDRKFENLGRKELANPVAEALRKAQAEQDCTEKCCYTCEYFKDTDDYRHRLPWCTRNEQDTTENNVCDDWKLY